MYAFVRKSALALLATVAVVGVGASPAQADEGDVTWTVRTASNKFGEARSSYTYSMNPGAPTKDAMVVANRGKDPLTLTVYAADGFTTDTGQLDLRTKDQKPVGIGAWLKTDRASISLAPGKTTEVPFTVTVPANATPGDYVGGIITSLTQPSDQPGINVERRLGIRVKLRVGGDLAPSSRSPSRAPSAGSAPPRPSWRCPRSSSPVRAGRSRPPSTASPPPSGWPPPPTSPR